MKDADLRQALEPVREHFSGREVTVNTVLAAHLRSRGLPASGRPWESAKAAMLAGAGFADAVEAAEAVTAADALLPDTPPAVGGAAAPAADGVVLDWFPKQFGPGDIDGVGARRLLGTPSIDPAWILARETGQNSWDARGASTVIDFTMNLKRLDRTVMAVLRERIFTGDTPGTGLPELLRREEVWALEISDRGTVGLGGPIRNDRAVDPGEDTNFIDLVFNIGAPRDVHLGGGTYGFGKTISYVASSVGTILIWSHCEGPHGLEHRLIGTAIGDGYDWQGCRYTGRHWWGAVVAEDNRVEPVVGEPARELAELVFTTHFKGRNTGTNILILDPRLGGASPEEDVQLLAEAVTWNLWPKLLTDQTGRSRMRISVQFDGRPVPLPGIEDHPVLSGHAQCLLAVRATQAGDRPAPPSRYPVEVHEIWCRSPRTLLGHLALTRYPMPRGVEYPSHSITLMRHQAELVVKSLERRELDVEGFQWAGVFKPVASVDDSFAMAEPPAHDDWVPRAVTDKPRRREVNVALQQVRKTVDEWLTPLPIDRSEAGTPPSVAHIGDMLAGLLAGLEGPAPSTRSTATSASSSTGAGRRAARPQAELRGSSRAPAPEAGWTRTTVDVLLTDAASDGAVVEVVVRVGVDGGSMDDASAVRVVGWHDDAGGPPDPRPQRLPPGGLRRYTFDALSDLAIDVQTRLVDR